MCVAYFGLFDFVILRHFDHRFEVAEFNFPYPVRRCGMITGIRMRAITSDAKAPTGCIGVGGDPGESVYVKFGAAPEEPSPVIQEDGTVRMNVDIGQQAIGGADAVVIGNIATSITDCHNEQYELKELETAAPLITRSDPSGTLWIFVGTDSGFEGKTALIYTQVRLTIHKQGCR